MEKKKILLRLYNPHDIDLISLMIDHQMDIVKAVYCSITAFANNESFVIRIPPLREHKLESKRVYSKHLILDLKKDSKVIQLLEIIEPGYRNNFLKNILRLYLCSPATESFFIHSDYMELFKEHYACLTRGKRFVNAANLNRSTKQEDMSKKSYEKKVETSSAIKPPANRQESIQDVGEEITPESEKAKEDPLSKSLLAEDQAINDSAAKDTLTEIKIDELQINEEVSEQKPSMDQVSEPSFRIPPTQKESDYTREEKKEISDSDTAELTELFTALLG